MSKKKPYYQSELLRAGGYDVFGKNTNPRGMYNPDKAKFIELWTNYDMNQCCSRYVWKNLPNGLESWNLERMLYFRGSLCGFKYGGLEYILPYTMNAGSLNPYGKPSKVKPITYNGQSVAGKNDYFLNESFELPVDVEGNETADYNAVLLYDSIPYMPSGQPCSRYAYNQILIEQIADVFARININIVVSNKKILLQVKDPKQKEVIETELYSAFGSDSPFALITSELDVNNLQNSNDYNAEDLFNTLKNYDAIRCFMSGISSKGFGAEKKERLVTGELTGAEEEKDLILDNGFDLRKQFADLMNAKFGTNIIVEKRADSYEEDFSTEMNGNNQTAEEETQGGDSYGN